jgi:sec-independent protein translocase protein TatA
MPFNNIGPMELIIVLVIALIVIGPKRLPEVGKSLGRGMREFKDSLSGDSRDDDDEDVAPPLRQAK